MNWLMENGGTILVSAVLLGVVAAIVVHMVRQKKAGRSGCGCGCEGCANRDFCHPPKK